MDFSYSEQQEMMRNTARDFAKNEIAPLVKEIMAVLSQVFSSVKIQSTQCLVYALPKVRLTKGERSANPSGVATDELIQHYTPNRVKFEIVVTLFQKQKPESGIEKGIRKIVYRWLNDVFENLEITSSRLIDANGNNV